MLKKLIIENQTFTLKKKTLLEKVMKKEDAVEYFDVFLKEYLGTEEYTLEMGKEEFVNLILDQYSISNEKAFVAHSNAFVNRRNTLVGYMMSLLCQLDYKATELIHLTQSELFEVFTLAVYNGVCMKKPELAKNIADDLEALGITKETATVYINNGIPENSAGGKIEKVEPRTTTDEEDIRQIFKELK
ncbi:MAG: hypothetical protein ACRCX2_30755 [Paraclostridium sp.]